MDKNKSIIEYGLKLNRIFHTKYEDKKLYKKLLYFEKKANKLATDYCKDDNVNIEQKRSIILRKVLGILGLENKLSENSCPIMIDNDPRGYTLKIRNKYVAGYQLDIYKDFGGNGILAPDFK